MSNLSKKENLLIDLQEQKDGSVSVMGRDLYEFLEINSNYTTWFERMTEYGFSEDEDFIPILEKSNGGRPSANHVLTIDMAKEVSMIQRNEKGKQARQYFIQIEKAWNSPEMIMKRALEFADKRVKQLEIEQEQNKPYTNFGLIVSNSDGAINIGEFCKNIFDKHGVNIGRNKMFKWLRDKGYLINTGREKNNPKQKYIEQGLFKSMPVIIARSAGNIQDSTTLITGKGQIKLTEKLLEEIGAGQ